jgi:hypothetical protein
MEGKSLTAYCENDPQLRCLELAISDRFSHPTWADVSQWLVSLAQSLDEEEAEWAV